MMSKIRNILTVHFLLYKSQLTGGTIRCESYSVEVLLSHLLQKLQTAHLATATVSRSARAFLCHFHCEKWTDDDALLHRFCLHVVLRSFLADVVSQRQVQSCAWDWLRYFFFFPYYSSKFMRWHKRSVSVCAKRRSLEWLIADSLDSHLPRTSLNEYSVATIPLTRAAR